jgi:predicted nucleic acid-binding protein
MAYTIYHLDKIKIKCQYYFLDANLWLKVLKPNFNPSPKDKKYLQFFQSFANNGLQVKPKIILTVQLISEIVNRYMRDVAMAKYIAEENINPNVDKSFFKQKYRQTEHYKIQFDMLLDDIKSYHNICELRSDKFGEEIKLKHLLNQSIKSLDFNDHYFYLLAKHYNFSIVTDDSDFFVQDVEVYTYNDNLYQKGKDSVVIKNK